MNPAIPIVRVNGENVDIDTYAKEALINRHATEKATKHLVGGMGCQAQPPRSQGALSQ